MTDPSLTATGSGLCGAVACEVDRPLRDVVLCHCTMCRKTHGHFAAYAAARPQSLSAYSFCTLFSRSCEPRNACFDMSAE